MNLNTYKYKETRKRPLVYLFALAILAFSLITFTQCGSESPSSSGPSGPSNPGEPTEEQGANEVWMVGTSFNKSDLEVTVGTTVMWTNQSSVSHTVTSGNRGDSDAGDLFDSGTLGADATFSHTFEEVGTFEYFCGFHAGMSATITVVEE